VTERKRKTITKREGRKKDRETCKKEEGSFGKGREKENKL
jgi:hypothetical protein